MGVPSFYRWLVNKYPDIVVNAVEEEIRGGGGGDRDTATMVGLRNPKYDNLYLDMNGIIHPCFHPDDDLASPPMTFEEVFNSIFRYIDRLFGIVRPRRLLYFAIDGVAPRAKMNQQRSRRFQTAKHNEIAEAEENRLRTQFEMEGKPVLRKQESEVSDSNIITPATVFMNELSKSLQRYINQQLKTHPGWKNIKVILSDSNVPGEGEHKIMSFIRHQRTFPDYDPNTRHCLYGLDADLIMLALATHEVHFSILREDVLTQVQQPECALALETSINKAEPSSLPSRGWYKQAGASGGNSPLIKKPYQFLHVWILREYLNLDLKILEPPKNIKIDLERIIDDFIFMCFFTGNDFIPHMPTLEIHEGAIDLLMHVYKEEFKNLGGYLVDMQWARDRKAHCVKLKRVEKFILLVGTYEEKIFKKRSELRERKLRRLLSEYSDNQEEEQDVDAGPGLEVQGRNNHCAFADGKAARLQNIATKSVESTAPSNRTSNGTPEISQILQNTKELKERLKSSIRDKSDLFKNGIFGGDKVRLGATGFKERYYKEKFSAATKEDMESTRKAVVQKYTEGLCWVVLYYFSGVPSWTWFYPYHYGPFASDLKGLSHAKVIFQKGSPFKPFDQLMSVLPPKSGHALPRAYQELMTSDDSGITDFYPADFEVDAEGKRFMWQAICKLPFIDEHRLLSQTKKLEAELRDDEAARNATTVDKLFVSSSTELASQIFSLHKKQIVEQQTELLKESIDTNLRCGINGFISPCNEDHKDSQDVNVLCVFYELINGSQHVPRPIEGVEIPEPTITEDGIVKIPLWHEYHVSRPWNGFQNQRIYRKTIDRAKFSTTKSSADEMPHKGAGSGWSGTGRGKQLKLFNNTFTGNGESYVNFPVGNSERLASSALSSCGQPRGAQTSNWNDARMQNTRAMIPAYEGNKWKLAAKSANSVESEGIEDLRISDSRQGFNAYGRARYANTNFGPSGNGSSSDRNNYEWRQSVQLDTRHVAWQHNQSALATPSIPAYGRRQYMPDESARNWNSRDRTHN